MCSKCCCCVCPKGRQRRKTRKRGGCSGGALGHSKRSHAKRMSQRCRRTKGKTPKYRMHRSRPTNTYLRHYIDKGIRHVGEASDAFAKARSATTSPLFDRLLTSSIDMLRIIREDQLFLKRRLR